MERVSKTNYYLDIAQTVAERGTCLRRCFGAIIVKNDSIISTGYNGAPRGRKNCSDLGYCRREQLKIPRGERYELCRSVHAEANAIIAASRENMIGSTLYMACIDPKDHSICGGVTSCAMCKRLVINAGIDQVIVRETESKYSVYNVKDWVENDDSLSDTLGY
ncbi:MAG: dCMP deaminase family protein [Clostridia bacterium]|nr:dCMP deaminase family protein [Clostridia bacterium]